MESINQIFEFDMQLLFLTIASIVAVVMLLFIYGAVIEPILIRKGILNQRINHMTRAEVGDFVGRIIDGQDAGWEIDDFSCEKFEDPLIQELANELGYFCGEDEQLERLKLLKLRLESA